MKKLFDLFTKNKSKKLTYKQMFIGGVVLVAFLLGLVGAVIIINHQMKDQNQHVEVTFVEPHTALVFWNTKNETIGYVKFGTESNSLDQIAYQTSSQPGQAHAVILENVPLEGYKATLHNESDPPFLFSKAIDVVFIPEEFIE